MFNLMRNCYNWACKLQQPLRNVTVLVIGLDKAGKTLCTRGMLRDVKRAPLAEVSSTHGCVRYELTLENILVNLLDTGGGSGFRVQYREYYGQAHGVIFVVDSSDRHRIKEVKAHLTDLIKHPQLAGKPLLILANKQDRLNAFLGSELVDVLSLDKLVNQSQSLCHIEPCSALMDLQRWSDRKTLRGLWWLVQAVSLDYPNLNARVVRDTEKPEEKEKKAEKSQKKNKGERIKDNKSHIQKTQRYRKTEQKTRRQLQPTQENSFPIKLKQKKLKGDLKPVGVRDESRNKEINEKKEKAEENVAELDGGSQKETLASALLPGKRGRLEPKAKVETMDNSESNESHPYEACRGQKKKKKKKKKMVNSINRINTENNPANDRQPADLSATFDLYRRAILALKAKQDQNREQSGNTLTDDTQ